MSCAALVREVLASTRITATPIREELDVEPVPMKLNEEIRRHGDGQRGLRAVAKLLGIKPAKLSELASAEHVKDEERWRPSATATRKPTPSSG